MTPPASEQLREALELLASSAGNLVLRLSAQCPREAPDDESRNDEEAIERVKSAVNVALAALSSPQGARPTWQPMETAPKDGTPVIGYMPGGSYLNGFAYSARRCLIHWRKADSLNKANWTDGFVNVFPTHWMPLPDPPLPAPSSAPPRAEEK